MQPTRIRSAAVRVLRRGRSRSVSFTDLAAMLAQEECINMAPHALADSLRDHDAIILLESTDLLSELPLLVHEQEPAYHAALGTRPSCYAAVYSGDDDSARDSCAFDALAAPLLQAWRDASANPSLRSDIARALGALYVLTPAIEDAANDDAYAADIPHERRGRWS
jgi:hypothetical protein